MLTTLMTRMFFNIKYHGKIAKFKEKNAESKNVMGFNHSGYIQIWFLTNQNFYAFLEVLNTLAKCKRMYILLI